MRRLRAFLLRLAGSFGAGRRDREIAEELEEHVALHVEERVRSGMPEAEARREALVQLGGMTATRERVRDRRGFPVVEELRQDLRYAARSFRKSPGFAAVTVVTLALGIGAATAIFSIVNGILIAPLPFRDAERLVAVWEENADRPGRRNVVGPANFIRWNERQTSFSSMTALYDWRVSLSGRERPEELIAQTVTANFFATLGVEPLLGRGFAPDEGPDGRDAVTVLSWGAWQRSFGGDPGIVGRTILLNGQPVTVIGVAPRDFGFFMKSGSLVGKPPDLWLPFAFEAESREPRGRYMSAFARLRDGVTLAQARAEMKAISASLAVELPRWDAGWTTRLVSMRDELSGEMGPALAVLGGAVGFVLLIVCVNVANLLLARGMARRQEMAIRAALGAGRGRVVRQLLTETLVLALVGGFAGWWVARAGIALLSAWSPVDPTILSRIRLSLPVLGFSILLTLVAAVLSGLAPAFESAREGLADAMREGARAAGGSARARKLRQVLVVAEVALAAVLLVGAGLLLRSFSRLARIDPGFDPHGILAGRVTLSGKTYEDDERVMAFFRQVVERARAIPGVREAGAVSFLPFAGLAAATSFSIVGEPAPEPGQEPSTDVRVCDNGHFAAMRVPLKKGRLFEEREMRVKSNVVVVSESFARQFFPRGDAIGRKVVIEMSDEPEPTEIVGIVGDIRHENLANAVRPMAYWPHPQLVYSAMTFTLRTDGDPAALSSALEAAVHAVDRNQPIADLRTMESFIGASLSRSRFSAMLLALFACVAVVLAAVGIYGVMSYVVGQRRSEIGIRLALGATGDSILRMVVAGGARLVLVGLAIGVPTALMLSRFLQSLLFETSGFDPVTLAGVVASLAGVAIAASYVPAWRASRVAPLEALRN